MVTCVVDNAGISKYQAFCTALTAVSGVQGVKDLGAYAFKGCTALASLSLTANVAEIGESAFADCTKLSSVSFAGSLLPGMLTIAFVGVLLSTMTQ